MSNPEIRPDPPAVLDTAKALLWLLEQNGYQVEFGAGFDADAGQPGYMVAVTDQTDERRIVQGSNPVGVLTEICGQLGFVDLD